jgi:NADH-quinone oxidoreductase subunit G
MPKQLIIDGKAIEVEDGITLIQACEQAGVDVPRFCYHERLSIAGNCRMCLIEVQGVPKPVASCAMGVNDLMPNKDGSPKVITTLSPMVKKAREGVMEFLLLNHPLDCPICDQGGECDLQDQAMAFGVGGSRFAENKRAVEDKYLGPLIKTFMTRCIQCTRCVRFMTEVAGVEELGAIGRGEDMEITTYLEKGMLSEMSANVVDLCPVGALTHRPWSHTARPWEFIKTESIDVMDAVGSAVRVDARGRDVMNEEWISDKSRHVAEGLRTQRLDQPYVRVDGRMRPASWDEALKVVADKLKATPANKIGAIAGDLSGAEEMFALKDLMTRLGSRNIDCRPAGDTADPGLGRASYLFNGGIEGIEAADAILLIGTNPRVEAAVLNTRIRKRWRQGGLQVAVVGEAHDFGYNYTNLGVAPAVLTELAAGRGAFADVLKTARHPIVIVGANVATRPDGAAVMAAAARIALNAGRDKNLGSAVFNVLHTAAARVGGLDLGFVPADGGFDTSKMTRGAVDVLFLLGADDVNVQPGVFVVYQGTHGDRGAHRADVILPGAAYTEKAATYVNTEGRSQMTGKAVSPPGVAKEDWSILRALSSLVGPSLSYDTVTALRASMYKATPQLARLDSLAPADVGGVEALASKGGAIAATPFTAAIADFYLTNPIARASTVLAELSAMKAQAVAAPRRQAAE